MYDGASLRRGDPPGAGVAERPEAAQRASPDQPSPTHPTHRIPPSALSLKVTSAPLFREPSGRTQISRVAICLLQDSHCSGSCLTAGSGRRADRASPTCSPRAPTPGRSRTGRRGPCARIGPPPTGPSSAVEVELGGLAGHPRPREDHHHDGALRPPLRPGGEGGDGPLRGGFRGVLMVKGVVDGIALSG